MAKDRVLENKKCPRCWKGILYSTNIVSKRKHVYYQCAFCGRMITRIMFKKLIERAKRIGAAIPFKGRARKHVKAEPKFEQPGMVVGVVKGIGSKKPIGGAYVYMHGIGIEGFTNSYGQYALKPVPSSVKIIVEASKSGYVKKGKILRRGVGDEEVRKMDFLIRKSKLYRVPPPEFPKLRPIWAGPEAKRSPRPSGIHGFVRNIIGAPLQGAMVTIFAGRKEYILQTDAVGHFELLNILPPGYYQLKATADGFSYERRTVRVDFMFLTPQDFRLHALPRRGDER